jgi:hypothetical protein
MLDELNFVAGACRRASASEGLGLTTKAVQVWSHTKVKTSNTHRVLFRDSIAQAFLPVSHRNTYDTT